MTDAPVVDERLVPGTQKQDSPWLHVPWPVDGQRRLQFTLHAPQFRGSVWMLTHTLLQAVCSGGRQVTHSPPVQIWFSPQAFPHAPQFSGSESRSTQVSPQRVSPSGQTDTHVPPE